MSKVARAWACSSLFEWGRGKEERRGTHLTREECREGSQDDGNVVFIPSNTILQDDSVAIDFVYSTKDVQSHFLDYGLETTQFF